MKLVIVAATLGGLLSGAAAAQVQSDVTVRMQVTADTTISVTGFQDVAFTTSGVVAVPEKATVDLCIQTAAPTINVTADALNATNGSAFALQAAGVAQPIHYSINGGIDSPKKTVWGGATSLFDLSAVALSPSCQNEGYLYQLEFNPLDTEIGVGLNSIQKVVEEEGLGDGVSRTFSDVVTLTIEGGL